MGLPIGFQPRACPFCGGRHLLNEPQQDGTFRVFCLFCGSGGRIGARSNDEAWLAWSGIGPKVFEVEGLSLRSGSRPCPFCGSRNLHGGKLEEGVHRVMCFACGAAGPICVRTSDEAWQAWAGDGRRAPVMFGAAQEILVQ